MNTTVTWSLLTILSQIRRFFTPIKPGPWMQIRDLGTASTSSQRTICSNAKGNIDCAGLPKTISNRHLKNGYVFYFFCSAVTQTQGLTHPHQELPPLIHISWLLVISITKGGIWPLQEVFRRTYLYRHNVYTVREKPLTELEFRRSGGRQHFRHFCIILPLSKRVKQGQDYMWLNWE